MQTEIVLSMALSHQQNECTLLLVKQIVSVVHKGHNLLITGQAASGKSTVVKEIMSALRKAGFNVSVVCTSGIACTVYDPGVTSTVHSHYGLGVADLPLQKLVE